MTIEAMKLALNALKDWDSLIQHQYTGSRDAMSDLTVCAQATPTTIQALRAAIEQAEEQRPHYTWQYAKDYIASRQAERQEPVVWRKKWAHKNGDEWEYSWFKRYHDAEPLYTAPPQRSVASKPLTDDEILYSFCHTKDIHQFIQAFKAGVKYAESAHGIKE